MNRPQRLMGRHNLMTSMNTLKWFAVLQPHTQPYYNVYPVVDTCLPESQ